MTPTKRPPPDNHGNLEGRILALRIAVARSVAADIREGADPEKARSARNSEVRPQLEGLQRRLKKLEPIPAKPSVPKPKVPEKPTSTPQDEADLLEILDSL